jgi:hypothetical protein
MRERVWDHCELNEHVKNLVETSMSDSWFPCLNVFSLPHAASINFSGSYMSMNAMTKVIDS